MRRKLVVVSLVVLAFALGAFWSPKIEELYYTAGLHNSRDAASRYDAALSLAETTRGRTFLREEIKRGDVSTRLMCLCALAQSERPGEAIWLLAYVPRDRPEEKTEFLNALRYSPQHASIVKILRGELRQASDPHLREKIRNELQAITECSRTQ